MRFCRIDEISERWQGQSVDRCAVIVPLTWPLRNSDLCFDETMVEVFSREDSDYDCLTHRWCGETDNGQSFIIDVLVSDFPSAVLVYLGNSDWTFRTRELLQLEDEGFTGLCTNVLGYNCPAEPGVYSIFSPGQCGTPVESFQAKTLDEILSLLNELRLRYPAWRWNAALATSYTKCSYVDTRSNEHCNIAYGSTTEVVDLLCHRSLETDSTLTAVVHPGDCEREFLLELHRGRVTSATYQELLRLITCGELW